ncbi:MAG: YlxR family protein [Clostridia bacterium]|nr:YlxR family protein [Clostridia bacterium]
MKQKKIPERLCLGCNVSKDKRELIRVVKTKQGEIFLDKTGKANGRGAYICNNARCLEKAIKTKRIARSLSTEIPEEIYQSLRQAIDCDE